MSVTQHPVLFPRRGARVGGGHGGLPHLTARLPGGSKQHPAVIGKACRGLWLRARHIRRGEPARRPGRRQAVDNHIRRAGDDVTRRRRRKEHVPQPRRRLRDVVRDARQVRQDAADDAA